MQILFWSALTICAALSLIHLVSVCVAILRCRPKLSVKAEPGRIMVTIIRPVCGVDNYCEETLRSTFGVDYGRYEVLFCVASEEDPVVPIVRRAIAEHPA